MSRPKGDHKLPIHRGLLPVRISIRDDVVINKDLGVTSPHSWDDGREDKLVGGVIPVLDYGVEVVCSSAYK